MELVVGRPILQFTRSYISYEIFQVNIDQYSLNDNAILAKHR